MLPAGERYQRVLTRLPSMLGVMLYPYKGSSQPVLLYHLRRQVLDHVGYAGVLILRQLGADHHRILPILLIDADTALAPIRPIASVMVDIVVRLHLVLLGQEDRGIGAVSLGNDPDALLSYRIGAEDAPAVLER